MRVCDKRSCGKKETIISNIVLFCFNRVGNAMLKRIEEKNKAIDAQLKILETAIRNYFMSLSSLIILCAPPNLSMHQSTYRISTQIVRFRSLSNAILWLNAS